MITHYLSVVSFEKLFEGLSGSIDLKPLGGYLTSLLVTGYYLVLNLVR